MRPSLPRRRTEKRRKQDLVIRASQPSRRAESPNSLFDKRYDASTTTMPRRRGKSLRAEKQAERLKFFALVRPVVFVPARALAPQVAEVN